jgi:hypothetical protein
VTEIILAIDAAKESVSDVKIQTSFEPMKPMGWAQ